MKYKDAVRIILLTVSGLYIYNTLYRCLLLLYMGLVGYIYVGGCLNVLIRWWGLKAYLTAIAALKIQNLLEDIIPHTHNDSSSRFIFRT